MARYIDADEALRMMRNSKQDCPVVDDKRSVWDVAHNCAISCVEATPTADVVPRAEVAREIFEEIEALHERIYNRYVFEDNDYCEDDVAIECAMNYGTDVANCLDELKKKYTEGENENDRQDQSEA